MDGQLPVAIEYDQVVAGSLVGGGGKGFLVNVNEKDVAVFRTVVVPVLPCDFDGRGFGVFVIFVWDSGSVEVVEYFLSAFHGECLILYCRVEVNRFLTNYSFLSV